MKKFFIGLLVGMLIMAGAVSFAAGGIRNAFFNNDSVITIDGKPLDTRLVCVEEEGEQWGRNYVSVRDIAEGMGGKVVYNGVTKEIEITTYQMMAMATPEPTPTPTPIPEGVYEEFDKKEEDAVTEPVVNRYTDEKGLNVLEVDGVKYLDVSDAEKAIQSKFKHMFIVIDDVNDGMLKIADYGKPSFGQPADVKRNEFIQKKKNILIPHFDPLNESKKYMMYDFYVTEILPLMQ